MHQRTVFRIAVRVIGVFITANGAAELAFITMRVAWDAISYPSRNFGDYRLDAIGQAITSGLLGVYLFTGPMWIVDLAAPPTQTSCANCGYDVTMLRSPVCPECGTPHGRPAERAPAAASGDRPVAK